MVDPKIAPKKPGLYLAKKNEDRPSHELVVRIHGASPFLQMTVWDIPENTLEGVRQPHENWVWGERIGGAE